jgi:exopolysaccharide biosynthesis polyprenyl glycosylphosphotransferase
VSTDVWSEAAEVRLELVEPVELAIARPAPAEVAPRRRTHAERGIRWGLACLVIDGLMLLTAGVLARVAAAAAGAPSLPLAWMLLIAVGIVVLLARRGLYTPGSSIRTLDDAAAALAAVGVATAAGLAVVALAPGAVPPAEVLRFGVFAAVYVVAGRLSLYRSELHSRRTGEALRPTLLVGAGRIGRLVAERLLQAPELGLRPVGFLDKDPADELPLPVLGASWDLDRAVAEHGIEQVIVCFSRAPDDVLLRLVSDCERLGIDVAVVPRLFEKTTTRVEVDHVGALPLMHIRPSDPKSYGVAIKYALDRVIAGLMLVVLSPVLIATALAVWQSLGRPILFRQLRVGRDGRRFRILKFRSMRPGAADVPESERLTRVGAFIRRTSLDELPQLINVLRGEMSLVGPRPERPELVEGFEQSIYRYGDRHRVKSGITGWAQVHGLGRGEDRFGEVPLRERVEWDNFYIENWSFWLDVKIAIMTALAVLRFRQT